MQAKHTELPCSDCNTNPALNDDSRGIKWIQGNVVKAEPCGCTIEGRGFCNYPIHIHYCDTHKAAPDLLAALKAYGGVFAFPKNELDREVCYDNCRQPGSQYNEHTERCKATSAAIARAEEI